MPDDTPATVTRLLRASAGGDEAAAAELMAVVYDDLRRIAQSYMSSERREHTLEATALVHEAYLRLVRHAERDWGSRSDFFAVASQAMRRILVDHARAKKAAKRGGQRSRLPLDGETAWFEERGIDLVDLDSALDRLAEIDPRRARLVELRFFGGLEVEQAAEMMGISARTAAREWAVAKAWLRAQMAGP